MLKICQSNQNYSPYFKDREKEILLEKSFYFQLIIMFESQDLKLAPELSEHVPCEELWNFVVIAQTTIYFTVPYCHFSPCLRSVYFLTPTPIPQNPIAGEVDLKPALLSSHVVTLRIKLCPLKNLFQLLAYCMRAK